MRDSEAKGLTHWVLALVWKWKRRRVHGDDGLGN